MLVGFNPSVPEDGCHDSKLVRCIVVQRCIVKVTNNLVSLCCKLCRVVLAQRLDGRRWVIDVHSPHQLSDGCRRLKVLMIVASHPCRYGCLTRLYESTAVSAAALAFSRSIKYSRRRRFAMAMMSNAQHQRRRAVLCAACCC